MELISLKAIHSGGQTGCDTAALIAASILGIRTGGYAPVGWLDETGPNEAWMREMDMKECRKPGWNARTEANVAETDGTVIISHELRLTGGSYQTACIAEALGKPWKQIRLLKDMKGETIENGEVNNKTLRLVQWLNMCEIRTLNIAGPRESKCPGIGDRVCRWLVTELG